MSRCCSSAEPDTREVRFDDCCAEFPAVSAERSPIPGMPPGKPSSEVPPSCNGPKLRDQLLSVLEEHHAAMGLCLEQQHMVLRTAIERVCCACIDERMVNDTLAPECVMLAPVDGHGEPAPEEGKPETDSVEQPEVCGRISSSDMKHVKSKSKFVSSLLRVEEGDDLANMNTLRGCLRFIISHPFFDFCVGGLVVLSTIVMFVKLEVEAPNPDGDILLGQHVNFTEAQEPPAFVVIAHFFNVAFLVELVVRLYVKRLAYFLSVTNLIEGAIVVFTTLDAYVFSQFSTSGKDNSISFMRLVRFARIAKAMRVIRTMSLFRQLRVLLSTIAMSFMSLLWSLTILFIFMLMFSLFLCQLMQGVVLDADEDNDLKRWVYRYYGSSTRALYTVFEITFSGGWPNYARPLVEQVGPVYGFVFFLYVTAVVFAMVRIISAIFLKDTLQTAANDADMMVQEKNHEVAAFTRKLAALFELADQSGDGQLSLEELENVLSCPKVKVWMSVLGVDTTETRNLFSLLDDGDGLISYGEFVAGISHLKGTARSQDTFAIMRDCARINKNCEAVLAHCEAMAKSMHALPKATEVKLARAPSRTCLEMLAAKTRTRSNGQPQDVEGMEQFISGGSASSGI